MDCCNSSSAYGLFLNISSPFEQIRLVVDSDHSYTFIHLFQISDHVIYCDESIFTYDSSRIIIPMEKYALVRVGIDSSPNNELLLFIDEQNKVYQIIFLCVLSIISLILVSVLIIGLVIYYYFTRWLYFKKNPELCQLSSKLTDVENDIENDIEGDIEGDIEIATIDA
ncbi:hypothetical protein QTN25_002320 [Entamoeba marina]